MSDTLLPYYDRELNAIRALAREFAAANPKIAARLRLTAGETDDPHVERVLEGAAFLAARVHHRLDDEFPELTDALLGTLYPHYLAPVPSCAMVQFHAMRDAPGPVTLPTGVLLDTEAVRGETCRFSTSSAVTLWPVEISAARLGGLPLTAPPNPAAVGRQGERPAAVLRLTIRCQNPALTLSQLGLDRLRVFLRAPPNVALPLYEMLGAHVLSVALADGPNDPNPTILPASSVAPAGFAPEDGLLPWPARSFSGFRLLTEYFAFPEKFLFLDFDRLDARTLVGAGPQLDVFIYLDQTDAELERVVDAQCFTLGCVPAVNLFAQRCEPVALDGYSVDYRIDPDRRRTSALEVWAVERVVENQADGSHRPWLPFYRLSAGMHAREDKAPAGFYTVARRDSAGLGGSDVFLGPLGVEFSPDKAGMAVLSVDALCTNRDLAAELPTGAGHPRITLVDGVASVRAVTCLMPPTPTLRRPLRERGFWRLISHFSLGHLSLVGEVGAQALREMLYLYDLRGSPDTAGVIESLVGVRAQPGSGRVPGARPGSFCRGLNVRLEFDGRAWRNNGGFLLASVLDHFLALHVTVNSFVRTSAGLRGRPGQVAEWPARAGYRSIL